MKTKYTAQDLEYLKSIGEGEAFILPWRTEGRNVGEVLRAGVGSISVRVPKHDGDGWEVTQWAPNAHVVPCERDRLTTVTSATGTESNRVRSTTEKPVETVHRICKELHAQGKGRKEMLEACIAAGVNPNTAKTQYYHWRKNR